MNPLVPVVLVGSGAWLYEQVVVDAFTAFCGEGAFYAPLCLGVFVVAAAFGAWVSDRVRAGAGVLAAVLAVVGGLTAPVLFFVATTSVRLRTGWLPQLRATFPEDASLGLVISRFDGMTVKAFLTSTLPMFAVGFTLLVVIGALVGHLLPRLLKSRKEYVALAVAVGGTAVVFPLLLQSCIGTLRLGAFAALLNISGAAFLLVAEKASPLRRVACAVTALVLALLLAAAPRLEAALDRSLFHESVDTQVISSFRTSKHRVAVALSHYGVERSLYVDRYLQFSYSDEAAQAMGGVDNHNGVLVHPAVTMARNARSALVLGQSGAMIERELLRHPGLEKIVSVDDDAAWIEYVRKDPELRRMNAEALADSKIRTVVADPVRFVRGEPAGTWNVIVKDFPMGVTSMLGRATTVQFFRDLRRLLAPGGILAVHSDYYGTRSFWTLVRTLRAAGFLHVVALNDNWAKADALEGIILASRDAFPFARLATQAATKHLLAKDVLPPVAQLELMDNPELVDFQLEGSGATVSSLFRPTYLRELRQENGFPLPLVFPVGPY